MGRWAYRYFFFRVILDPIQEIRNLLLRRDKIIEILFAVVMVKSVAIFCHIIIGSAQHLSSFNSIHTYIRSTTCVGSTNNM